MDFKKIYEDAKEVQDNIENSELETDKIDENKTSHEPKEMWETAKSNVESMEKEFQALMRNPAVERACKADIGLAKTLKGLGTGLVGLSSAVGGLLKLGNVLIPGFGLISVPLAHALGGTRLAGQALADKYSSISPVNRVAPSTKKTN